MCLFGILHKDRKLTSQRNWTHFKKVNSVQILWIKVTACLWLREAFFKLKETSINIESQAWLKPTLNKEHLQKPEDCQIAESLSSESALMTQKNMINYTEEYRAQKLLINKNHGLLSTQIGNSIIDFLNIQVLNRFNTLVNKGWSLYSVLSKQSWK